ncbi:hypothetical protein BC936DRAFT_138313 [Jimgerdemannia flammicorona]|uniref:Uncharacterized protein n=1 Tax=Jimgerdemannia flammicorona TaxID=994334 RepID=A0A433DIH9_9FUNG|nr:hypothetical protein BC936DRAFT_138313 [Jimgerdemannia flammicorona]
MWPGRLVLKATNIQKNIYDNEANYVTYYNGFARRMRTSSRPSWGWYRICTDYVYDIQPTAACEVTAGHDTNKWKIIIILVRHCKTGRMADRIRRDTHPRLRFLDDDSLVLLDQPDLPDLPLHIGGDDRGGRGRRHNDREGPPAVGGRGADLGGGPEVHIIVVVSSATAGARGAVVGVGLRGPRRERGPIGAASGGDGGV